MANDFSGDLRCKALWRFENGALTTDTQSTNTLTSSGSPVADTGDYQEGSACLDIEYATSDYLYITDANLVAGFPLKNGDTVKRGTFCFWLKQESQTATYGYIVSKYHTSSKRSLGIVTTSNVLHLLWGISSGTSAEDWNSGIAINNNEWYHVTLSFDGVAKTATYRVYSLSLGTTAVASYTFTSELNVSDAQFRIGNRDGDTTYRWDGKLDELVVFTYQLTSTEAAAVRAQTFPPVWELLPTGIDESALGSTAVVYDQNVSPTGIASTEAFGSPNVKSLWLHPTGVDSGEAMGVPEVSIPVPTTVGVGGFKFTGEGIQYTELPPDLQLDGTGGFRFSGADITGAPEVDYPVGYTQEGRGGFQLGGGGEWTQTSGDELPVLEVTSRGGFKFGGAGTFSIVTPPTFTMVGSGGFRLGGFRTDRPTVTIPELNTVIGSPVVFTFGGEGVWSIPSQPGRIITPSKGVFTFGGAGIFTATTPPALLVSGSGGFVMTGSGLSAPNTEVWVLSGQSFEPSMYTNYGFNSFAKVGTLYLGAKADGIYLLSGEDDSGQKIVPGTRIGPTNLGNAQFKRIRSINVGDDGDNIRVRIQGNGKECVSDVNNGHAFGAHNVQARTFTIDIVGFDKLSHLEITALTVMWD